MRGHLSRELAEPDSRIDHAAAPGGAVGRPKTAAHGGRSVSASRSSPSSKSSTPATLPSATSDSKDGETKVWLRPKKDTGSPPEALQAISEASSPKSNGERSPRPTSFPSSISNGVVTSPPSSVVSSGGRPPRMPDGPVKTTDIKSPEEVTGVRSPSPESWTVQMDTGHPLTWTNGTVARPIATKMAPCVGDGGPLSL